MKNPNHTDYRRNLLFENADYFQRNRKEATKEQEEEMTFLYIKYLFLKEAKQRGKYYHYIN